MMLPSTRVRRLTPVECERLMGWPDDHTAGVADSHRYRMCGNGVASPVAEWIATQINRVTVTSTPLHVHAYQLHRPGVALPVWRSNAWSGPKCVASGESCGTP